MKYEWHDDGDLLILLPVPAFAEWEGVNLEDQRILTATQNWSSLIPFAGNIGLLFGGDPGQVVFARDGAGVPTLIRWIYADDGDDLVDFALRRESLIVSEPDLHLDNSAQEWMLFDALAESVDDDLPILWTELPVGKLRITTDYLRGEVNSAIVHAFHHIAKP